MSPPSEGPGRIELSVVPDADLAVAALRGERAISLAGLRACLRQSLLPQVELADPPAVRLATGEVAIRVAETDPWLDAIARRGARAWQRVVDSLGDAAKGLADRQDELARVAQGHDAIGRRARVLLDVSSGVDRWLERAGMVDPSREASLLAQRILRVDATEVAEALLATDVRVRGIVDWSPADVALIRALDASLSRVGGRATIELPVFDKPLDAERGRDPLDALIEAVATALDDAPLTSPIAPTLATLVGPDAMSGSLARVELRHAIDGEGEALAVADAVRSELARGAAPRDVVVVLAAANDSLAASIVRLLRDASIQASDVRGQRVLRSNLGAFVEYALDVVAAGMRRQDVAVLLRSPYIDARALLADDSAERRLLLDAAAALERTPTASGADPGARIVATVEAARYLGDRAALKNVAERVAALLTRVHAARNRLEHVQAMRTLVRSFGLARAVAPPATTHPHAAPERFGRLEREARARDVEHWWALRANLDAYARAAERLGIVDRPASLDVFRHELGWVAKRSALNHDAPPATVRLVDLVDLVDERRALVVIAGADEDSWPDGSAHLDLVPRALSERLEHVSDPASAPLLRAGPCSVAARLALGVASARRVVFTWSARDDDGVARGPCLVVAALARGEPGPVWRVTPAARRPLSPHDERIALLAREPDLASRLAPEAARRAFVEERRAQLFGLPLAPDDPLTVGFPRGDALAAIVRDETGGGDFPISASAIDALASCVFKGYVGLVLHARRPRVTNDLADSREAGEVIHTAVEAAFRATAPMWAARPRNGAAILRDGMAAVDAVLASRSDASQLARVAASQARRAAANVLSWSLADEEWDFSIAEQAFGEPGGWPAVTLERAGTKVAVRGRIDRIDVAATRGALRVIDYKSKESAADAHTKAFGRTKLQLALYGRAAEESLGLPVQLGAYVPAQRLRPGALPRKAMARWSAAHERVDGLRSYEHVVLNRMEVLRRGDLAVRPVDAESCAHCDFDGVCRKPAYAPGAPAEDEGEADGEAT